MGKILSALPQDKPILVMLKRASFREIRNDHQVATVHRLREMGKIDAALDEAGLRFTLEKLTSLPRRGLIGPFAEERLLSALRQFIAGDAPRGPLSLVSLNFTFAQGSELGRLKYRKP